MSASRPSPHPRHDLLGLSELGSNLAPAIAVSIVLGLIISIAVVAVVETHFPPATAPSALASAGSGTGAPGTIGCAPRTGEQCLDAAFVTQLAGLTLANLRFEVANLSPLGEQGPRAPPLPLGAGAQVAVLWSPSIVAGVWNLTTGVWEGNSGWTVPEGPSVAIVLDTGLTSSASLASAVLYLILVAPFQGALGFPLA